MRVAIDISPLKKRNFHALSHRVRGTGFYIENLTRSLQMSYPKHTFILFKQGEYVPDVDLVHCPYFEPFFLTLPFWKRGRMVVTVHDLIPLIFPKYFSAGYKGRLKWAIQRFSLTKTDSILTDSESSKRDIVKYASVPEEKVAVVHLAAKEEFMRVTLERGKQEALRKKYNLPEKFVLYVGDVTWNKNLPRLIEAVKKINVNLVLVGSAILEENFDRTNPWNQDLVLVQKLIRGDTRINPLGFVERDNLIALYNLATVFAMPSLYEGFGLPVLEAMTCGCPVVTTNRGALAEIADSAAYYVDPESIKSIASGIGEVFFTKNLQLKLSRKGLIQAKKFNWEKTARETFAVYEKVVQW